MLVDRLFVSCAKENLNLLGLDKSCAMTSVSELFLSSGVQQRPRHTLNLLDGAGKDVLLDLAVLELRKDLGDDGADELGLLRLAGLALVTNPRVESSLDLGSEGGLLLKEESLVLELGSLLQV